MKRNIPRAQNTEKKLTLKNKQKEILLFIYRYRFLNRKHLQSLLLHKQHNRLNIWLKELSDNNYLNLYYFKKVNSRPAVYSLGTEGRKYLRYNAQKYNIRINELNRIRYEKHTKNEFQNRLQFLADVFLSLCALTKTTGATLTFYTKVDLKGINNLPAELPDGFFSITEKTGTSKRYFLILLKPYMHKKDMSRLLFLYVTYYTRGIWQKNNPHPFPEIIFICAEYKTKNLLNKIIKNLLKREPRILFSLTTQEEIRKQGINKKSLERVII